MIRLVLLLSIVLPGWAAAPIRLHPENSHYFEFRGKPTVLITSGEHYGALVNLDFDYTRYFKTLRRDRLNLTRVFTGVYREQPGAFNIASNTLAPHASRFIAPWPRGEMPGATDGGNKFDLSRWDEAYFRRLKDFMRQASKTGIVVELVLFCPYYEDRMWDLSPLNVNNNVNGVGDIKRTDVLTLKDKKLLAIEEEMVRKIVSELREFDNLYYEISNEPYFGGVTLEWQAHIANTIARAEAGFPARHLIAQNIANGSVKIDQPNPLVSVFNFHYSRPPESLALNYVLNRVIGMNETGFDGVADEVYRIQGWDFLFAGGALYNNLDYSFTAGHEDGTFVYPPTQPGGGSTALRKQLGILRDLFDKIDFVRMQPEPWIIKNSLPQGLSARVFARERRVYAVYLHTGNPVKNQKPRYIVGTKPVEIALSIELPKGRYRARWIDPKSGLVTARESFEQGIGQRTFRSPSFQQDAALIVERQ